MSFPDQNKTEQDSSSQKHNETAQQSPQSSPDNRQQAIEQEQDTARLRSESKSVEDGSGSQPDE